MSSGNSYLAILIESLTGSPSIGVADPAFVRPTNDSTEPEYLVHIEHWAWRTGLCSTFRKTVAGQGHKTVAQGRHFVIVELRSAEPPVDRVQAKASPCD
jgi:hypothetical protein